MAKENLDRYSVTMDRFGGLVTAPINSTILGCRKDFMIATYHAKIKEQTKSQQNNSCFQDAIIEIPPLNTSLRNSLTRSGWKSCSVRIFTATS